MDVHLAAGGPGLVVAVGFLEGLAGEVVQVTGLVRREQGPVTVFGHALHEQVGNPVGGVHVVGAAALVAGVLAQVEKFLDVDVPGFQVGAHGALALAALIDGYCRVIGHLEKGHHALALAVGALDVGTQAAHGGPVVAQAAGELGQQGVVADGGIDAVQVVGHGGQVAAGELRPQGAGVEQGGRGAHEVEAGEQVVELDGLAFAVDLVDRQAHGHAHEERLGQLETDALVVMDEVAVVEGLQAQVGERQVAAGLHGGGDALHVVLRQARVQQLQFHRTVDVVAEIVGIDIRHLLLGLHPGHGQKIQGFAAQYVHEQAGGGIGIVGLGFDEGAGAHHQGLGNVFFLHAVEQVAAAVVENDLGVGFLQAAAGFFHQGAQTLHIEGLYAAVGQGDVDHVLLFTGFSACLFALLGAGFAVEHVVAGHLVLAGAHQGQFHLILDIFYVYGAAVRVAAHQGVGHLFGDVAHHIVYPGGCRRVAAFNGEEGLGDGDGDLVGIEGGDLAVAADDTQFAPGVFVTGGG